MKLYLSLGHIWTGTQKDAKDAQGSKDFVEREIPTDKPGLMAWLNAEWAKFQAAASAPEPVAFGDRDAALASVLGDDLDEMPGGTEPVIHVTATHGPGSASAATSCPACQRDAKVASMVVDAEASINIRADIEDVMELETADDLIARMQRRRAEIFDMERGNDADEMLG